MSNPQPKVPTAIFVKAIIEGQEQAFLCSGMESDPIMTGCIRLSGMQLTIQGNLAVQAITLHADAIKYYAIVNPLEVPSGAQAAPPAPAPDAVPTPSKDETPDNGVSKKKVGRVPRSPGKKPQRI